MKPMSTYSRPRRRAVTSPVPLLSAAVVALSVGLAACGPGDISGVGGSSASGTSASPPAQTQDGNAPASGAAGTAAPTGPAPERLRPVIVAEHPWDVTAFTQGTDVAPDGQLVVGTGLYGSSRIYSTRVTDAPGQPAGSVRNERALDRRFFGEGIAIHGDTVWQLTWKEGTAFKRRLSDLDTIADGEHPEGQYRYAGEGWGLCSDGTRLLMSDGSGNITVRDPQTFAETGRFAVTLQGKPVTRLNELDCTPGQTAGTSPTPAPGSSAASAAPASPSQPSSAPAASTPLWANVWQTDQIYRIDPATGAVTGVVDAAGVFGARNRPGADVLNGIARIPGTDRYYVTGKLWDKVYEVRFVPEGGQ